MREVPLGSSEVIRFRVLGYEGCNYVDVRKWWWNGNEFLPSRKGIRVPLYLYDQLLEAIKNLGLCIVSVNLRPINVQIISVETCTYRGRDYVDVRTCWCNGKKIFRSKKGIRFPQSIYDSFLDALQTLRPAVDSVMAIAESKSFLLEGVPTNQKIYHITHIDNLESIVEQEELLSDSLIRNLGGPEQDIGMANIKRRRRYIRIDCRPGTNVGDYVPFYFCPRSVMLYKRRYLQESIIHLEADLRAVLCWAEKNNVKWAFSDANAASSSANFYKDHDDLGKLPWNSIAATYFCDEDIRRSKQAEFLVFKRFPVYLFERIGVHNASVQKQVQDKLLNTDWNPLVEVLREWYY